MSLHIPPATGPSKSSGHPLSILDMQGFRDRGERFAMVTAYDALTAEILDDAGVPMLLVGDSLGMVVLGYDSTVPVTVDEMLHHTAAVRRGADRAVVVGDMPFGSYHGGLDDALANAARFMKEAGAGAVKVEGGGRIVEVVDRLTSSGIPVMAHVGLTPQHVHQMGGFKVQGRDVHAADRIVRDARELAEAGAFAIVLEGIPAEVGRRAHNAVSIPTIGIGAGADTTGQVLVIDDLLGRTAGRLPRFVKPYANMRSVITDAVKTFAAEVEAGDYPAPEHRY